jgi:signal transduction histidine kinase/ActR/RegA family two-component response regulator
VGTLELRTIEQQALRASDRRTLEGGTVSTIWDITDDVARAAELEAARKLAEAASSAKSEFLASMNHELRTPLNAILGFAQLLQRDKKSPLNDRQMDRLDHVVTGGEHLLRLIDDVLDLSGIEAGRTAISTEPVNVREVLGEVKSTLEPMATRASIALHVEAVPADLPEVLADRTRFAQILINFGSNAIKYGRANGEVIVRAALIDDGLRVSVADDGIGIPYEHQDRIFTPFHRAGQETGPIQGTGIGLAITKRLTELMGGKVGFRSTPAQGSMFWIDLPAHRVTETSRPAPAATQQSAASALTGEGKRYKIIYVEDNPSNIAFMQELLEELDRVDLITVPNAEVGIELVRHHRPDIVIMDINLPGMSGVEATRKLRELPETKHIPVIALTAAAMMGDQARFSEAGFYRYLTKPVRVDELLAMLEEILER